MSISFSALWSTLAHRCAWKVLCELKSVEVKTFRAESLLPHQTWRGLGLQSGFPPDASPRKCFGHLSDMSHPPDAAELTKDLLWTLFLSTSCVPAENLEEVYTAMSCHGTPIAALCILQERSEKNSYISKDPVVIIDGIIDAELSQTSQILISKIGPDIV